MFILNDLARKRILNGRGLKTDLFNHLNSGGDQNRCCAWVHSHPRSLWVGH